MGYKTAYKDVMRQYEALREKAADLLKNRRDMVYTTIPKLAEIDNEISATGISSVKLALAGDAKGLKKARAKAVQLEQAKEELLAENGIAKDYFTAIYNCMLCQDTGYLPAQAGHANLRCACLKQRLIEEHYSLSNIKGILEEENFEHFDHRYFSPQKIESEGLSPRTNMQNNYHLAMNFVNDFETKFGNLLLYGDTGLGKTFVCHCIAKDLLDKGHTVLYLTAPRLFKIIEDYRFNRGSMADPDEMIDAVTDVDLLILDDLGAEFITVITTSALFDIVNQRLLAKKHTVISTNLSPDELEGYYSERIISRFTGNYLMMKFFGEDLRVRKKYGGIYA